MRRQRTRRSDLPADQGTARRQTADLRRISGREQHDQLRRAPQYGIYAQYRHQGRKRGRYPRRCVRGRDFGQLPFRGLSVRGVLPVRSRPAAYDHRGRPAKGRQPLGDGSPSTRPARSLPLQRAAAHLVRHLPARQPFGRLHSPRGLLPRRLLYRRQSSPRL